MFQKEMWKEREITGSLPVPEERCDSQWTEPGARKTGEGLRGPAWLPSLQGQVGGAAEEPNSPGFESLCYLSALAWSRGLPLLTSEIALTPPELRW